MRGNGSSSENEKFNQDILCEIKNPYSIEEKYLNPLDKILMYLFSIPQSPKLIISSGIHSALTTSVIVNTIEFISH